MAEIKVSELNEASQINDNDLLMIVQNGENKKITKENCQFASGDEVAVSTTEPSDEELKLWINPNDIPSGEGLLLNKIYPVGSIYINTTGVNPSTFLGGTWSSFGAGRVLVGQDTNDTDFANLGDTGGSKYLQEHTHTIQANDGSGSTYGVNVASNSGQKYDGYIGNSGTGNSGNLQPYIVVSMWVRIA